MNGRVVLIDDDPISAKFMRFVFVDEGYETRVFHRGSKAVADITGHETDLVILDVDLPDIDGYSLCTLLRGRGFDGPIVFLSERGSVHDKVEGFRHGADDYIVKPYEPRELLARAENLIRRSKRTRQIQPDNVVRVHDAELVVDERTYRSDAMSTATLTATETRVLECLMRNDGLVVTRDLISEWVWGMNFLGDNTIVDLYVRRVRQKIERDPVQSRYLHIVPPAAYVFRVEQRAALVGVDVSSPGAMSDTLNS